MNSFFWVSPRESDGLFNKNIEETIAFYSSGNIQSTRPNIPYGNEYNKYLEKHIKNILSQKPDAKFMFYNSKTAYSLSEELYSHFICMNSLRLLNKISDKVYTRFWLSESVPTLSTVLLAGNELNINKLKSLFQGFDSFVIQENRSSGGFGTYILTEENFEKVRRKLYDDDLYIVSPYIKNSISTNSQFIIFDDEILLLPCSVQIVLENDNRLLYRGGDFLAFRDISHEKVTLINRYTLEIAEKLKKMGYRGICGIDYLTDKDNVFFQEINARFQASSIVINKVLAEENLPSIQELNIMAFKHQKCPYFSFLSLNVNYSMFKILGENHEVYPSYLYSRLKQDYEYVSCILDDGYTLTQKIGNGIYAYQVIFNTNIVQINPEYQLSIYPNLLDADILSFRKNMMIDLKIALLNQGCRITTAAQKYMEQFAQIKKAVFRSIDFTIFNDIPINAPCEIKFSQYSPYIIDEVENKIILFQYNEKIGEITVELENSLSNKTTLSGVKYSQLAYSSTDRLRLKHAKICYMKEMGGGCIFCNIPTKRSDFSFEDLKEVIDAYIYDNSFNHILIGGASENPDTEHENILKIVEYLRKITTKPLYLMSLPPIRLEILDLYHAAGINEVAFNIEIFNETIARQMMPVKGNISRQYYIDALSYAVTLWGRNGNVRTAFIAGLEPIESTLKGIENVCSKGIQPMISVFRPMPGTKLENWVMPSNSALKELYNKANTICENYDQILGPSCRWCRNNMLGI